MMFFLLVYSCQTYEGGFSAVPGCEAHGGYAFCGFAAALLLNKQHLCDTHQLLVSVYTCWMHQQQVVEVYELVTLTVCSVHVVV